MSRKSDYPRNTQWVQSTPEMKMKPVERLSDVMPFTLEEQTVGIIQADKLMSVKIRLECRSKDNPKGHAIGTSERTYHITYDDYKTKRDQILQRLRWDLIAEIGADYYDIYHFQVGEWRPIE